MSNFLKVVPLWRLSGALAFDQSRGPNGGMKVLYMEVRPQETAPVVTRTVAAWVADTARDSMETIMKELNWELALEVGNG